MVNDGRLSSSWGFRLPAVALLGLLILSCAGAITHPVYIRYQGTPEAGRNVGGTVALQPFVDRRQENDPNLVGYRSLSGGRRERYATIPENVAEAVTRAVANRLERTGADIVPLKGWEYTPEEIVASESTADYWLGGEIEQLHCEAKKELLGTTLKVEAHLVFYLGDPKSRQVRRRPVQIRIERFEAIFKPEKVELRVNEAVTEAMDRGLGRLD